MVLPEFGQVAKEPEQSLALKGCARLQVYEAGLCAGLVCGIYSCAVTAGGMAVLSTGCLH